MSLRPYLSVLFVLQMVSTGFAPRVTAAAQPDTAAFRRIAVTAMATELTPAMSVAVAQGNRIIWHHTFGEADLETHRPAGSDTRFYIASTSKALTGLAAARLAHRGEIDLDAPLSRVLPDATVPEGLSADSIRVIDLLTHTHGISLMGPVSLRTAFTGEYTNAELLHLLGTHPPARRGRSYQYSNLGYDLIGLLLAPQARGGWKDVVDREVLEPLGMKHTTAYRSRLADDDIAMPHELGRVHSERVRLAKEDANLGPAGGHFSTARDLARLVVAELNGGTIDGGSTIPMAVLAMTQQAHASQDRDFSSYHRHGWGIGWDLGTYETDTLLHRFGGFAGYYSHVSFMPDHHVGVVVLTNGGRASSRLADAVANAIYDRLLVKPDAESKLANQIDQVMERGAGLRADAGAKIDERAARPQALPLALGTYTGTYYSEVFGTLKIEQRGSRLEAIMGVARSPVDIINAEENELQVELFGWGTSLKMIPGSADRMAAVELLGERFERR